MLKNKSCFVLVASYVLSLTLFVPSFGYSAGDEVAVPSKKSVQWPEGPVVFHEYEYPEHDLTTQEGIRSAIVETKEHLSETTEKKTKLEKAIKQNSKGLEGRKLLRAERIRVFGESNSEVKRLAQEIVRTTDLIEGQEIALALANARIADDQASLETYRALLNEISPKKMIGVRNSFRRAVSVIKSALMFSRSSNRNEPVKANPSNATSFGESTASNELDFQPGNDWD